MRTASTDHQTRTGAVTRPDTGAIVEAFKAARAAGDLALADAIKSHAALAQRSPSLVEGSITLVLRDGRRVPLHNARAHIKRTARPGATMAGDLAQIDAVLRSGERPRRGRPGATMAGDLAAIAAVTSGGGNEKRQETKTCHWCGSDWFDQFGECNICGE